MRLIKPSFEIIEQESGLDGLYKHIERCGRLSYKSEDKITEESAKPFINRLINSKHLSVLEHGTVYLKYDIISNQSVNLPNKYYYNEYSKVTYGNESLDGTETEEYLKIFSGRTYAYITTNLRVLVENGWEDDLEYLCEPTEYHEPRISVKFTCSRSISHELVRHRVFSFIQESQRYCSYNKGKYGGEITYIIPSWSNLKEYKNGFVTKTGYQESFNPNDPEFELEKAFSMAEEAYLDLVNNGYKPQEAREVLPNATKTEIIMTGFLSDWVGDEEKKKGFFPLRCDSAAHPDMRALAIPLREEFVKRGLINKDYEV